MTHLTRAIPWHGSHETTLEVEDAMMMQYKQWFVYSGTYCDISTVRYVWTLMYLEKWYVMYVQVWTVVDVCMYIEVYMCGSVQVLYCIEKCITWDVYSRVWTVGVIWSKCKWHAVRNIQWYLLYDDDLLCYDLMYTLWCDSCMMHSYTDEVKSPEVAAVCGSFQWILQQWMHKWTKKNSKSNNLLFGFDLSIQHRRWLTDLHANNNVHKYSDLVMRWK